MLLLYEKKSFKVVLDALAGARLSSVANGHCKNPNCGKSYFFFLVASGLAPSGFAPLGFASDAEPATGVAF
jgi:hypothetical protein